MSNKVTLKEIRATIKAEQYDVAIEKCQSMLSTDPDNHMIYVLLGAAYQSTDKSKACENLRKALKTAPGPLPVALQGLANCAPDSELPEVYQQLLVEFPEKRAQYYEKLFALSRKEGCVLKCFEIFKQEALTPPEDLRKTVLLYTGRIWHANNFEVVEPEAEIYVNVMETLLEHIEPEARLQVYKNYLKELFKLQLYARCIEIGRQAIAEHPSQIFAYEWLCKIYCYLHDHPQYQTMITNELKSCIHAYATELLNLHPKSSLAFFVKAIGAYESNAFVSCRAYLQQVLDERPHCSASLELLARTHMAIDAFELALPLWQQLQKKHELYAECLSHGKQQACFQTAVDILESSASNERSQYALARCYHKLDLSEKLEALCLDGLLMRAEFLLSGQPEAALELLENEPPDFELLILRAKLLLKLGRNSEALSNAISAARLRPYSSECFDYLGRIYLANKDVSRARKCFEKCVHLNPLAEHAINYLCTIYQELNEVQLIELLLLNALSYITDTTEKIHFGYRFGLVCMDLKKWDEAIQSFRNVIKENDNNAQYWQSLGDAYIGRGSYNSALRVFEKVLDLEPHFNLYAKLQIANIKMTVHMYIEAIADFTALLQLAPDYLPALKGAVEAHHCQAVCLKAECRYERAREHLQLAVNHLQKLCKHEQAQKMVWYWRLAGTVFLETALIPKSVAYLNISGPLPKDDEMEKLLTRSELLQVAKNFYTQSVTLKNDAYAWYDLAYCYYSLALYAPEEYATAHLQSAQSACVLAIKQLPKRWESWNLLGVINMRQSADRLPLAQHCFIHALTLARRSYTAWLNLGTLYLRLDELLFANKAFGRAQQANPSFPNAWIGQALVADAYCNEVDAIDLFRHCQRFQYHPLAALGYAKWVCTALANHPQIVSAHMDLVNADVVALDAINRYVRNEESNSCLAALTYQAYLSIRQGLYRPALRAYTQAAKVAQPGAEIDCIYTNIGFLYLKLHRSADAITVFNQIMHAEFNPAVGLAHAYKLSGQIVESCALYEYLLESASSGDARIQGLQVAVASLLYEEHQDDAKTSLTQSIQRDVLLSEALYAVCAFGLLHTDNSLLKVVMPHIQGFARLGEQNQTAAFLVVQYKLAIAGRDAALAFLLNLVQERPDCAEWRRLLAQFLLDYYSDKKRYNALAANMALVCLTLDKLRRPRRYTAAEESEVLFLAARLLRADNSKRAKCLLQDALYLHPENEQARRELVYFYC